MMFINLNNFFHPIIINDNFGIKMCKFKDGFYYIMSCHLYQFFFWLNFPLEVDNFSDPIFFYI